MNFIQKPELIFLDFDGVISKNAVFINLMGIYQFINQYTPIPLETFSDFFKCSMTFPLKHSMNYLLLSLGIEDKIEELYQYLNQLESFNNIHIKIEEDFYSFLDFCDNNSIRYLIYSSADKRMQRFSKLVHRIGNQYIYNLNDRSKANYHTYLETAKELDIDLKKTMYIDDHPLALRTGKLHGMTTVMMINDVFTMKDYNIYHPYIDHKINSFTELETIITKSIQKECLV